MKKPLGRALILAVLAFPSLAQNPDGPYDLQTAGNIALKNNLTLKRK